MATDIDKLAYWTQHRHAWQSSGLTQRTYCNQEGLSFPAFAHWCKRVIRTQTGKDSTTLTLVRARAEVARLPVGTNGPELKGIETKTQITINGDC